MQENSQSEKSSSSNFFGSSKRGGQHRPNIELSDEERAVLKSCWRETVMYKCIPYAVISGVTTHLLTMRGILKASPKFGSYSKVVGVSTLAFFAGASSFSGLARKRLMELPNSQFGDMIREGDAKRGGNTGFQSNKQQSDHPDIQETTSDKTEARFSSPGDMNSSPGDMNDYSGTTPKSPDLDESQKPTLDSDSPARLPQDEVKSAPVLSYEELRRRNRGGTDPPGQIVTPSKEDATETFPRRPRIESKTPRVDSGVSGVKRNKYGDLVE